MYTKRPPTLTHRQANSYRPISQIGRPARARGKNQVEENQDTAQCLCGIVRSLEWTAGLVE